MTHLSIDIETYSDIDIGKAGLYKYSRSPNFEILLFAYSVDFGPVQIVDFTRGEKLPLSVAAALMSPDVQKHAYNAPFEITCINAAQKAGKPGGLVLHPEQWRCTMMHGLYLGYPAGLARVGDALGLAEDKKKMSVGKALINYFCKPCKPTKSNGGRTRNLPEHDPEKWELFKTYCKQDVVTEMEIYKKLSDFPVPDAVQEDWVLDYIINSTGIRLDHQLITGALAIDAAEKQQLISRAIEITGLQNPNSRQQLLDWINDNSDKPLPDLTKATVAAADPDNPEVKELLDIRKKLAKSSISKYTAMETAVCEDGRVRGLLQYYGARTGRWAGRLVQVQNLPRNYIENLDLARELVKKQNGQGLALLFGDTADTLSQLIRTAFIAPEGKMLCVADFSAIEARVIAWLADEQWRQKVFAEGGDIYCASASNMFGVPVEKHGVNGHLRQKGKVAELALGYQGGANALITMGALEQGLTEDELPDIVQKWRTASPNIVRFWRSCENAALSVMEDAKPVTINKGITFAREMSASGLDFLTIMLPSGRKIFYPGPYLKQNQLGKNALYFRTLVGSKWANTSTYGGKLVENITQAVARDCLAAALRNLVWADGKFLNWKYGNLFVPLMHIHDEIVSEVPETWTGALEEAINEMCRPIPWAPGLLLNAAGFTSKYYMKD